MTQVPLPRRLHDYVMRFVLIFAFAAGCIVPTLARSDTLEAAMRPLLADSFAETENAIAALATTGDPRALSAIQALQQGKLLASTQAQSIYIEGPPAVNVTEGTRVSSLPSDAVPIRINNRLRRAIEAALGSMTLLSPDAKVRMQAAESVFKSRDAGALPMLDRALTRETVPALRTALETARAAVVLANPSSKDVDRLAAVTQVAARGDQDAIALLRQTESAPGISEPIREAVALAISGIEQRLRLLNAAQNIWYGLSLGSVLLLAAIGLAITFGVMGVINMAHGEMVMIGAYTTFVVQEAFRAHAPAQFDWSLPVAIPLAFIVAAAVGVALERGVIRFLYGRPLETLLATFGISLILQQAVRSLFGPTNREVGAPSYMSGSFELVSGFAVTYGRLWILVFTLIVFAALLVVLKATPLGLQMRAVTQNRRMAASMGIRTGFVDAATFALGSGIAGVAGVALSQIDNVSPNLGQGYIIDSFMVVVFGGVGNLWGTLISAFFLGIANKLLEPFAGAVLGKIAILVLLILFIQKRPRGLFALKGRAVDA